MLHEKKKKTAVPETRCRLTRNGGGEGGGEGAAVNDIGMKVSAE